MVKLGPLFRCVDFVQSVVSRKKLWLGLIGSMVAVLAGVWISSLTGAETAVRRHLVEDWSARHVVFTSQTAESAAADAEIDPRAWHSWMGHGGRRIDPRRVEPWWWRLRREHRHRKELETDWNMTLGGLVGPRTFPAKFSFDVNAAPDCTNDYVVFPTSNTDVPGAGGAGVLASLVGFNNLYTGPGPTGICPTPLSPATQPSVMFAYNTTTLSNASAYLSPTLSLDGKKIAFVESNSGGAGNYTAFHVLTWKAGEGTDWDSAAAPGNCSAGNSCMTTLVLSNTRSDTQSNLFIDYAGDAAYVGDDGGLLHKISSVFSGTPAEVTGNGWPVQVASAPDLLQSPVYDSVSGRIFLTDQTNGLYVVNAATGIVNTVAISNSRLSDVIIDSTDQTVFVFYSDSNLKLSVSEFDTSGAPLRSISAGTLAGNVTVFSGTFDNNYYNSPSSGSLYFAGAVGGHTTLYGVGFTGKTMNATFSGPLVLATGVVPSLPTPLTEIFNPSLSNAQDRLFLGIDAHCTGVNSDGCIESLDISSGFPTAILSSLELGTGGAMFSVSAIVVDNVSPSAQASSIYFESRPTGVGATGSAIKLTQSSLQ